MHLNKFIFLLLSCICFAIIFTGCSDDDEEEQTVITGSFTYKDNSYDLTTGIVTFRGLSDGLRVYDLFLPAPGNNAFLNYRIYTTAFSFTTANYSAKDDTESLSESFSISSYVYLNSAKAKLAGGELRITKGEEYSIIVSCTDEDGNNVSATYTGELTYTDKAGQPEKIKDADANSYNTVLIANDIWMAENLKTTKYNDGTEIILADAENPVDSKTPCYSWYDDDSELSIYGALYNLPAVNSGKLCPEGWHIPGEQEWADLLFVLEGDTIAGGKMKEKGTRRWKEPNEGASNDSGFSAIPSGHWEEKSGYSGLLEEASWWSTETATIQPISYYVSYDSKALITNKEIPASNRLSVRCVKNK